MAKHPQQVAELGEGELLSRIFPRLGGTRMPLGPDDEAAVLAAPDGRTAISIGTLSQDQMRPAVTEPLNGPEDPLIR